MADGPRKEHSADQANGEKKSEDRARQALVAVGGNRQRGGIDRRERQTNDHGACAHSCNRSKSDQHYRPDGRSDCAHEDQALFCDPLEQFCA